MKKIYLAWQTSSDGKKRIRRFDEHGKFNEWQKQDLSATTWLENNGNPEYPHVFLHRYVYEDNFWANGKYFDWLELQEIFGSKDILPFEIVND